MWQNPPFSVFSRDDATHTLELLKQWNICMVLNLNVASQISYETKLELKKELKSVSKMFLMYIKTNKYSPHKSGV